mmetsp:Transcript_76925/g.222372  ORF Transcript_76925/g.222372 Transcript_76925/m.222372 type:complete len:213 (-) Transcript_76925:368-1006(-)
MVLHDEGLALEWVGLLARRHATYRGNPEPCHQRRQQPAFLPPPAHRAHAPGCPRHAGAAHHEVRRRVAPSRFVRGALGQELPLGCCIDRAHGVHRRRALDAGDALHSPRHDRRPRSRDAELRSRAVVRQLAPGGPVAVPRPDRRRRLERTGAAVDGSVVALGRRPVLGVHGVRDPGRDERDYRHLRAERHGACDAKRRATESPPSAPLLHFH